MKIIIVIFSMLFIFSCGKQKNKKENIKNSKIKKIPTYYESKNLQPLDDFKNYEKNKEIIINHNLNLIYKIDYFIKANGRLLRRVLIDFDRLYSIGKTIKCNFKIDISDKQLKIEKEKQKFLKNYKIKSRKDIDNHVFHFWDCPSDIAKKIEKDIKRKFKNHTLDFDLKKNSEIIVIIDINIEKWNK